MKSRLRKKSIRRKSKKIIKGGSNQSAFSQVNKKELFVMLNRFKESMIIPKSADDSDLCKSTTIEHNYHVRKKIEIMLCDGNKIVKIIDKFIKDLKNKIGIKKKRKFGFSKKRGGGTAAEDRRSRGFFKARNSSTSHTGYVSPSYYDDAICSEFLRPDIRKLISFDYKKNRLSFKKRAPYCNYVMDYMDKFIEYLNNFQESIKEYPPQTIIPINVLNGVLNAFIIFQADFIAILKKKPKGVYKIKAKLEDSLSGLKDLLGPLKVDVKKTPLTTYSKSRNYTITKVPTRSKKPSAPLYLSPDGKFYSDPSLYSKKENKKYLVSELL